MFEEGSNVIVRTFKAAGDAPVFRYAVSREVVARTDQVGHALYDTTLAAGAADTVTRDAAGEFPAQAHFCLSGTGMVTVDGRSERASPGTLVAARAGAEVSFLAESEMRICTVFGGEGPEEAIRADPLIRHVDEFIGTARDVFWGNGQSRRLLVKADGFGFALCQTLGNANTDSPLQYRHHFESCYYVSGSGEYVWESGSHPIDTNGARATAFIMNRNDAHRMVVHDPSICLSIFSPPIEGTEAHDFSGKRPSSY